LPELIGNPGAAFSGSVLGQSGGVAAASSAHPAAPAAAPATTIKQVVVIFDENISFDHYFGTYPSAPNPKGEPAFHKLAVTPTVNGLYSNIGAKGPTGPLLSDNPNGSRRSRCGPRPRSW
jgi:phospholipase C